MVLKLLPWLVLAVAAVNFFWLGVMQPLNSRMWDFEVDYTGGTVLRQRGSVYDLEAMRAAGEQAIKLPLKTLHSSRLESFDNPPLTAVLFSVLTFLPFRSARLFYLGLLEILYFLSVALLLLRFAGPKPGLLTLATAGFAALMLEPAYQSLALGQTDILLLFLMSFALWAEDRGWQIPAGITLGLGTAIKLSPGILILYFLLRQRWQLVIWAAITGSGATLLALGIAGPRQTLFWVTQVLPDLLAGNHFYQNQSFSGLIYRLVLPLSTDVTTRVTSAPDIGALKYLSTLANLAVFAVSGALLWRLIRWRSQAVGALGPALAVMVMLLGSSLTWEHYLVWTLIPLLALLGASWLQGHNGAAATWIVPLTIVAYLLITTPLTTFFPQAGTLIGRLGLSVKFYGLLVLYAAVTVAILLNRKTLNAEQASHA